MLKFKIWDPSANHQFALFTNLSLFLDLRIPINIEFYLSRLL